MRRKVHSRWVGKVGRVAPCSSDPCPRAQPLTSREQPAKAVGCQGVNRPLVDLRNRDTRDLSILVTDSTGDLCRPVDTWSLQRAFLNSTDHMPLGQLLLKGSGRPLLSTRWERGSSRAPSSMDRKARAQGLRRQKRTSTCTQVGKQRGSSGSGGEGGAAAGSKAADSLFLSPFPLLLKPGGPHSHQTMGFWY